MLGYNEVGSRMEEKKKEMRMSVVAYWCHKKVL